MRNSFIYKLLLSSALMLFVSALYSQSTAKKMAEPGTYQFIKTVIPKVAEDVFTTDILFTIENNRDENNEKILVIGSHTEVRILSRKMINTVGFVPLTPEVVYIDANEVGVEK